MDGATQCLPRVRLPVAQPPVPWGLPRFHPPTPRANPYPEVTDLFCRLPLSTLFYQLEAVHLGDLLRLSVRLGVKTIPSCGFSRGVTSASEGTKLPPLPERYPISRQTNSRVLTPLKEKITPSKTCATVPTFSYVAVENPHPSAGISTGFPFGEGPYRAVRDSYATP